MRYQVGPVQSTHDDQRQFAGAGFNIADERGAPIVTFGYLDPRQAANARELVVKAIENAAVVVGHSR